MLSKIEQIILRTGRTNLILIAVGLVTLISGIVLLLQRGSTGSKDLSFSSTAFKNGGEIAKYYTCDDKDLSPDFSINKTPKSARTLAIIIEDLSLEESEIKKNPFAANLIAWNIPATTKTFYEGDRPPGTMGKNIKELYTYSGPCPPEGETHTYRVTIYASDKDSLPIGADSNLKEVKAILEKQSVAKSWLEFKYQRQKN